MTERQPKLWTKDFVIAACAAFFVSFVFHILMVTIALYATETYHATTSEAGLAAGMFIIGALVVRLFVGYLIEAFGLKRMLLVSLLIYILSSFLYLLKVNLAFLLMNRFVHGVGMGMATTVTSTIVAQIIPPPTPRGRHRHLQPQSRVGQLHRALCRSVVEPIRRLSGHFHPLPRLEHRRLGHFPGLAGTPVSCIVTGGCERHSPF